MTRRVGLPTISMHEKIFKVGKPTLREQNKVK